MALELVCLDSMICIWGIKKNASAGQEHMIERISNFLNILDKQKARVIIPAPVITEILCPLTTSEQSVIINTIEGKFMIAPLDANAAIQAARVWHENNESWSEIYHATGETGLRNRFKIDTLIVGIAISNGADCLYTTDVKLEKLASKFMTAAPPPMIGSQAGLFRTR